MSYLLSKQLIDNKTKQNKWLIETEYSINTKNKNIFNYEYSKYLDDWLKFLLSLHL